MRKNLHCLLFPNEMATLQGGVTDPRWKKVESLEKNSLEELNDLAY